MKILKLFFIIFFIFSFNHLKANNEEIKIKITKNLRCLVCQGQSVYDSDSEFANSLKVLVDKKLEEGFSENLIQSITNYCKQGSVAYKKYLQIIHSQKSYNKK